jgi:TPR repeat protein
MPFVTTPWAECELSGDWAAVAAAAEGGDAKARLALLFAVNLSMEERLDWLLRAMDLGYIDALLYAGLGVVENFCGPNDEAELQMKMKEKAMISLQGPVESGLVTSQHAVGMLMYCFNCDSGAQEDFLDAARYIYKASRQGLDVLGLYRLNPAVTHNSVKAREFQPFEPIKWKPGSKVCFQMGQLVPLFIFTTDSNPQH